MHLPREREPGREAGHCTCQPTSFAPRTPPVSAKRERCPCAPCARRSWPASSTSSARLHKSSTASRWVSHLPGEAQLTSCRHTRVAGVCAARGVARDYASLRVPQDAVWCSVCACMQTQHKVQLDFRDSSGANRPPPMPAMTPPGAAPEQWLAGRLRQPPQRSKRDTPAAARGCVAADAARSSARRLAA
jgi:hypothetical protein